MRKLLLLQQRQPISACVLCSINTSRSLHYIYWLIQFRFINKLVPFNCSIFFYVLPTILLWSWCLCLYRWLCMNCCILRIGAIVLVFPCASTCTSPSLGLPSLLRILAFYILFLSSKCDRDH